MIKTVERKVAKVSPIKRVRASARKLAAEKAGSAIAVVKDVAQSVLQPGDRLITDRLLGMLTSGLADRIAEVIRDASVGEIQLKPHQLQIIEMILDRVEGKPMQAHMLDTDQVDEHTARMLSELLERRLAAEERER